MKNGHFSTFAKATSSNAKLSKMTDFVDKIEIDKIRSKAEIFPFEAKFAFNGL